MSEQTQPPQPNAANRPGQTRKKGRPPKQAKPFFLQRLRRQDIILLIGLMSLACLSVIVVGLLVLRFQQSNVRATIAAGPSQGSGPVPQATHTVAFTEITGLSQYHLAEAQARDWAADAQLTTATAAWPAVVSIDQVGRPGQWTYHFYSPGKERLYIVKVEPDGQLNGIEHVVRVTLPPPLLSTGNWVIDSPIALAAWLDYGGARFISQNPGLEVLMQLRYLTGFPEPVWMVIGTDQRTQDIHIAVVDTATGAVVQTDSTVQ